MVKAVEFMGVPGAGKSFIYTHLCAALRGRNNFYLPQNLLILSSLRKRNVPAGMYRMFSLIPNRILWRLLRVEELKKEAFRCFIEERKGLKMWLDRRFEDLNYDESEKKLISRRFYNFASEYWLYTQTIEDGVILYDEGFIQLGLSFFISPFSGRRISEEEIYNYLKLTPVPSKVVWVSCSLELCYQRLMQRKRGLPLRLKGLSKNKILEFLESSSQVFNIFHQFLSKECEVITIYNGEEGFSANDVENLLKEFR